MIIEPIGTFFGDAVYKYDAPRQGCLFAGHPGRIVLEPGKNFETALRDLDGFERLWVIFHFHENKGWRPTTRPPVPPQGKDRVGTFASRGPYRPNPIGLSCVRLLHVEGLTLYVDEADLLNGTPVLDIKPYIPMADSFPGVKAGWVEEQDKDLWDVSTEEEFDRRQAWLLTNSPFDILCFVRVQMAHGPFDDTRRRLVLDRDSCSGVLSYRTFRIRFKYDEANRGIVLQSIESGYSREELENGEDRYGDKQIHRDFAQFFA